MSATPMFPLGEALLPGAVLPLHVFEPRYRQMVRDVLADDDRPPEFGVVMIERGHEVGGGDARTDVGVLARIIDAQVSPDGRYALAAVGTERIVVTGWLPDDPYPRADVEVWPDEPSPQGAVDDGTDITVQIAGLFARVSRLEERLRASGVTGERSDSPLSDDARTAVWQLGSLAPLGAVDRHRMLLAPSLDERVGVLTSALDDAEAVWEFRLA